MTFLEFLHNLIFSIPTKKLVVVY